jgi:flagellar hook-associated protein 1 FlgK
MSGLFSSLSNSVDALGAHSRAIETTGKNLANVNNPSYARQRVIFGDRGSIETPFGSESMGLQALGLMQIRDGLLDQQVLREVALSASYLAEQQGYQRAQAGLGQSVNGGISVSGASSTVDNGIAAALDDFFNGFQTVASNPTEIGGRQSLLQSASILADRLHLADRRLDQVQTDLGAQATSDVSDANRMLQNIAQLNRDIARAEINHPNGAVDLRDQRQAVLEQLAKKLPIEIRNATASAIDVVVKDGLGADVMLVNGPNAIGTLALNGSQVTGGSPATVLALGGGSIQGVLDARDGGVQAIRDELDSLASQLVTSVNDAYNPTGSTGDFFNAANVTAGTLSIEAGVTAANLKASDGGPAGDNTIALAVAGLATKKFSVTGGDDIDGTFAGHFAKSVSNLGQALAGANARVENQNTIETVVRGQRDGVSGVSLDEELADLLKYQRAFQASSRVFSVVDELLDTVVNRMGV